MDQNVLDGSPEDVFRILLATDIHLGYAEGHPVRDNDTFNTFEEVLQIAARQEVDFILLGGDLFHDTRPSPYAITKCTELIRKYCLGDRSVQVEFLSDPSFNFQHSTNPVVNYEDPNMNVSIPIFSIHGNHDDPTGHKHVSALDLLSTTGLVNYIGRLTDVTQINIRPVLLGKGRTKLALYGLSHLRDDRLARLFVDNKVTLELPEDEDQWFKILVLHQNRADRGAKNFIPTSVIPAFIDLVVWGHEHDCRIQPVTINDNKTLITQPGSTVATSLCVAEAIPKHVGILQIHQASFELTPVELETVRPFIIKEIVLHADELADVKIDRTLFKNNAENVIQQKAMSKANAVIEEMIAEAERKSTRLLPLIRLVVQYTEERQVFNAIRFGQRFVNRVANPEQILKFNSHVAKSSGKKKKKLEDLDIEDQELTTDHLQSVINKFFEDDHMTVLSLPAMNESLKKFVETSDSMVHSLVVDKQIEMTVKALEEAGAGLDGVKQCLKQLRMARDGSEDDQVAMVNQLINDQDRSRQAASFLSDNDDVLSIDSDDDAPSTSSKGSARGRGRGRGRKSKK